MNERGGLAQFELRDWQADMSQVILEGILEGQERTFLQAVTGSGKTVIAGDVLRELVEDDWTIAVGAHRARLRDQFAGVLDRFGVPVYELARNTRERTWTAGAVTVFGPQMKTPRSPRRKALLVFDEAHHAVAPTWARLVYAWPQAFALSATPLRLGKASHVELCEMWGEDSLLCGPTPAELIDSGDIAPVEVLVPDRERRMRRSALAVSHSTESGFTADSERTETRRVLHQGLAIAEWADVVLPREHRQTLWYVSDIASAHQLADFIRKKASAYIPEEADRTVEVVTAHTSEEDRRGIFRAFETGRIRHLVNIAVVTEGVDLEVTDVVACLRPTRSVSLWLQIIGRGRRPKPEGRALLALDYTNNIGECGHPDTEHAWSFVPDRKPGQLARPQEAHQCPWGALNVALGIPGECDARVYLPQPACPKCRRRTRHRCAGCHRLILWTNLRHTPEARVGLPMPPPGAMCDECWLACGHEVPPAISGIEAAEVLSAARDGVLELAERLRPHS